MSATGTNPTLSAALAITGTPNDYEALVDRVGDARCVLIGEASHGTHEFYVERARMTHELIEGAGFNAIAVEADWLLEHLDQPGLPSKIVVWAHNSHVGDARHTEMGRQGQLTLGELARQRHGDDAFLVGQTTYEGTVTAASDWGQPAVVKRVVPGRDDAYEAELHGAGLRRDLLLFDTRLEVERRRLERAIGVIYRPETGRQSHYFHAEMARQFDAVAHLDRTQALWPLDRDPGWIPEGEPPDTYPFGV